jgi:hypothetical protein
MLDRSDGFKNGYPRWPSSRFIVIIVRVRDRKWGRRHICVGRKREDHLSFQHRHFDNIHTWYNYTIHKRDWDEIVQNAGIPPSVTLQIIIFLD